MLTHDETYVLNKIVELSELTHKNTFMSKTELHNILSDKYNLNEMNSILESLYEKKFIRIDFKKVLKGEIPVTILHDAKHHRELSVKKILNQILTSIILPVIVSVITAIITTRCQ